MNNHCTLCDLPLPESPFTDKEVEGRFCCSGCLRVQQLLQDLDTEQAQKVREEAARRKKKERYAEAPPDSCREAFLKVSGMHCTTCESFIETLAKRQPGVYKCEASYATELVKIYYDPDMLTGEDLPPLFSRMGYRARPVESEHREDELNTIASLVIGGFFSIIGLVIYVLFLYPTYLNGESIMPLTTAEKLFFVSNIFVMSSFVLFYTGFPILRGAWVSLSVAKPNMDLLVAIAALSAYLYSTGALLTGTTEVYFDVTMAIVMVVSIGQHYENQIKRSKNKLLSQLMEKRIRRARVRRNGTIASVAIQEVRPQDQIIVKAGERIPLDGVVVEGQGVVNEALITGESKPVSKHTGDDVLSGTILTQNALTIEPGSTVKSTIEQMIRLMWDIQAGRSGKQRIADRIAAYFVPGVLVLGALTFAYHLSMGMGSTASLLSALAVLVVSCPCALGLATPLAVASGLREALNEKIIIKTGSVFEGREIPRILALDKTGTLTTGQMQLLDKGTEPAALRYAQAIEQYSSHPLAKAIAGQAGKIDLPVDHFRSYSSGVSGIVENRAVHIGKPEWLREQSVHISVENWEKITRARKNGYVPVAVAWEGRVRSILVVGDQLRAEAPSLAATIKAAGIDLAIITGDSEEAARPLRQKLDPDFLFTGARPESKTEIVRKLSSFGTVAMVGDGSNDALALAEADLGIAFGDLTAIAAESAQIVIPGDRLEHIFSAFMAITLTKRRIRQNLGWAFLYNITTIPLAVAGLINPLFAALAMAASSLLVVTNSSRSMKLRGDWEGQSRRGDTTT
ncbi:heavy metal translocating P-type ATPase [Halalkalibaculum sp. DA3122]|uniref:heavy metal translocating P-type ATPase n=1 Tax=Halalkalibaculum sp. DA3122 TaxID=3373607 RepID=UPI0037541DF3